MTMLPCKRRCSLLLSAAAAILLSLPAAADPLSLRPYVASYSFHQGGMHVANARLELARSEAGWRWRMATRARGIYALFSNRELLSETLFNLGPDGIRLQEIRISNGGKHPESARFDWSGGQLEVMRKGERWQVPLERAGIYDLQSVHWLAASMLAERRDFAEVDFYRKGKLVKSTLTYSGEGSVDVDGSPVDAQIFAHVVARSKSRLRYYYATENPLLPLRIERLESGESPAVLTLERVDWQL